MIEVSDNTLRLMGLAAIVLGLVLVYFGTAA
jgi:uncharacterized protein YjeT (DUF2065 family)